jgi:methionine biosynthesis protein MetW
MLKETARVGKMGIVSFPNFAHWPNRLQVLTGRMPVTRALPYEWYDTPNIRVGTFADFEVLARKNRLKVLDAFGLQRGRVVRALPNLMASVAVFRFAPIRRPSCGRPSWRASCAWPWWPSLRRPGP